MRAVPLIRVVRGSIGHSADDAETRWSAAGRWECPASSALRCALWGRDEGRAPRHHQLEHSVGPDAAGPQLVETALDGRCGRWGKAESEQLAAAGCAAQVRDRSTWNAEGVGYRADRGVVRLSVVGGLGDVDEEGAVVGACHRLGRRVGPDADLDVQHDVAIWPRGSSVGLGHCWCPVIRSQRRTGSSSLVPRHGDVP